MEFIKSVFLNILIGILVLYLIFVVISPDTLMDVVGFRTFIVLSNSMEPDINKEDLIISVRTDEDDLEVGDIITFSVYIPELDSKQMVTHYIGDIIETDYGNIYKTHGTFQDEGVYDDWEDQNGDPYDIIYNDIEGKYLFKIPYVGYIQNFLANRTMVGLIIGNGIIIYILIRYIRKDDEEDYDY